MGYRLQTALTVLFAVAALVVQGCSQQRPAATHGGIKSLPFSVVATGDPDANMRGATTFAWNTGLQDDSREQSTDNEWLQGLLQESIIANLQGKGYRYSAIAGEGDLIIDYQVALDEPGASGNRQEVDTGELQPSLILASPDPSVYEKGTLVIEVTEKSTGLVAWRSALQGFANLELSDAARRKRIGLMVNRMLAGVPAK